MLSWIKDKIKGVKGEDDCIFCKIRDYPTNEDLNKQKKFLYEDETFYAIHDIKKASAQEHILVLTKKHYRSALDITDESIFVRMKQIGTKVLGQLQRESQKNQNQQVLIEKPNLNLKNAEKYRFGFHLPPYNSIDHIHLHGFLLPFTEWKYDKLLYGMVMTPVQDFIRTKSNEKK